MKRRRAPRIASVDLIEAAVHLLRGAPAQAWLAYYAGGVPFVLGLLFFWSDMSRSPFADRHLAGGSLGVALLFVWMKAWQAVFAGILRAQLGGERPAGWSIENAARIVVRQLALQPSGLFLLPIALLLFIPFGWLFTFYQNGTALGARGNEPLGRFVRLAWRQAKIDAVENHLLMSLLLLFGIFVLLNIGITAMASPFLLKSLLGVETPFTLNASTLMNTTFLAVICGLTYLCLDPLIKAAYVLRCFHGESRETGEDLLVDLKRFVPAMAALLLCLFAANIPAAEAERAATPAPAAAQASADKSPPAQALDRSIDRVLRQPEYTWRGPRPKRAETTEKPRLSFLDRVREWLGDMMESFGDWLRKIFANRSPRPPSGFSIFSQRGLLYGLIVFVAVLIGLLLYVIWRLRLNARATERAAAAAATPVNLADETVTAEQLPEDGWLRLASEMMERGDLRLALRALYLASLAHLAERELVTLARYKSNRDYERELSRRRHAVPEVTRLFSENVSTFDRVWYGLHDVTADLLQEFRANVEQIKTC